MRVALLINFVAPYRVPLLERLRDLVGDLRVMVSTPMESDRAWIPDWGSLDVVVQRNVTLRTSVADPGGFRRNLQVHVPYDTLPRLLRYRPDAVISVELGPRTLQALAYKMLRPGTLLLVWCKLSEHSERGWGRVRHLVRSRIFRWADGVLVNGESGARYVARFGVPDGRTIRINQPVDVGRFAEARRTRPPGAALRLLHVGTLTERKGVVPFAERLIRWARGNPSRTLEMCWLGDGGQRGELEGLAWPDNLRPAFLGNKPYGEVPGIYAECDILVFPTLLDEWGLVVNEAMAVGLPVLGSVYSQAVEELFVEGQTGWVFDPLDDASAAAALDRALAATPEALAAMRVQARRRIAGLTPDTAARRISDAMHMLARTGRTGQPGPAVNPMEARS